MGIDAAAINVRQILIDPTSRIFYASYYLQGLSEVFGNEKIKFAKAALFKELNRKSEAFAFEHYFAFIAVYEDGHQRRIVVDFCDVTDINASAYKWCDLYAKVNLDPSAERDLKLISIAPGFGIRVWNPARTLYFALTNLIKCGFGAIVSPKCFFHDYYLQMRRPQISDYRKKTVRRRAKPYVFMIATLWDHTLADSANNDRRQFIEAVQECGCDFEGGFLSGKASDGPFGKYIFTRAYSAEDYLQKTLESHFVFNTPAVHGCHGWKLAEFLCMGKAIISKPLTNALPAALDHGSHLHIVRDESGLRPAIENLIADDSYRNKLEAGARDYYNRYAKPSAVIAQLFSHFGERS